MPASSYQDTVSIGVNGNQPIGCVGDWRMYPCLQGCSAEWAIGTPINSVVAVRIKSWCAEEQHQSEFSQCSGTLWYALVK